MARRLRLVAVAGGVVVTACGHPDDNATQVLTQGLHSESGIQPEANTLGMVSGSGGRGTALSQVLESVVPTFAKAYVSFVSPADPNRICNGALGYEVDTMTLMDWNPAKLKDNYFWNKIKTIGVSVYLDRRCLENADGTYPPATQLTAWVYRPNDRGQMQQVETKISYDPEFTYVMRNTANKLEVISVARVFQLSLTNKNDIMELGASLPPVCSFRYGNGNIDFKIKQQHYDKSTDPTGVDVNSVTLTYLHPFPGKLVSNFLSATLFGKAAKKQDPLLMINQSDPAQKIRHLAVGAPVFFSSKGKPTCLYGLLSHASFPQNASAEMVFPQINELNLSSYSWYTAQKVHIPATRRKKATTDYNRVSSLERDIGSLVSRNDPRIGVDVANRSVSDHVLGKLPAVPKPSPVVAPAARSAPDQSNSVGVRSVPAAPAVPTCPPTIGTPGVSVSVGVSAQVSGNAGANVSLPAGGMSANLCVGSLCPANNNSAANAQAAAGNCR